jgi:NADPH-dependent ferric siderophore reductase
MPRSLRPTTIHPITTRTLQVLRVADVTPGMRRVTLGGPELKAHTAANGFPVDEIHCDGFDDHCKFILRHPDLPADAPAPAPTQNAGVLDWPHDDLAVNRSYTIRKWRPEAGEYGEMDVDFVKHGVGPATRWAYAVQPGEDIQIAGPKACATQPEGADWLLIAGDETTLPAIGRWLEEMPADTRGQVFIEVDRDDHIQTIDHPAGVEITWLPRNGAEAGTTTALFDAITGCEWWDGTVFAWVAGETLTLVPIRRWLRREKGLAKEQVDVAGYWRREVVLDEESGATENTAAAFHELTEIFPGVAVRVAVTLGLGPAFAGMPRTLADLVETTGADATGLAKLLRYLVALELVEVTDGTYSLTRLGAALDDENTIEHLTLTGVAARRDAGLLSLLPAVRTGTGDYARWFGADFEDLVQSTPELLAERTASQSDGTTWAVAPLVEEPAFADLRTLRITGKAPVDVALALTAKYPELRVSVLATPAELEAASSVFPELGGNERITLEPGSPLGAPAGTVDATLITGGLGHYPDADAVHVINQAVASSGSVLVFGRVLNEELAHDHDYEDDLLDFTLYGGGSRTDAEHRDLFARAGVTDVAQSTVGWGFTLYRLG